MIIRRSMGKDIENLLPLFREMHQRSRFSGFTMDEKYLHHMLCQIAFANAFKAWDGAMQVFIAEGEGRIEGFVLVACERLYHIGVDLMVSDLYFYVREGGDAKAADGLWDAVEEWANAPGVVTIWPGVSNAILENYKRAELFFKRRGYKARGTMLEKAVAYKKPAVARPRSAA